MSTFCKEAGRREERGEGGGGRVELMHMDDDEDKRSGGGGGGWDVPSEPSFVSARSDSTQELLLTIWEQHTDHKNKRGHSHRDVKYVYNRGGGNSVFFFGIHFLLPSWIGRWRGTRTARAISRTRTSPPGV